MKNKNSINKLFLLRIVSKIILLVFALSVGGGPAFGIDFITQKEFESLKSPYKNYPLKILFNKLKTADAVEKRKIKNTIILKQVFDPDMAQSVKTGVMNFDQTFGKIKAVSKDYLKVGPSKTGSDVDLYLGIDQIPLINPQNYSITPSNLGNYAAIIYSLDNRVYQIKISFLPAPPGGLYVQRDGGKNIVGWNQPSAIRQPDGYKLFVNEELFDQTKDTRIKVPRTTGQVDEYYVKAMYKHGNGFVDSAASDIQIDQISAQEIQKEVLAWETYDHIMNSLTPSRWQDAEKLLYENKQLLSQNLNQERKQNTAKLIAFFSEIDEGDHLTATTPESVQKLESALMFYQRAEQKAKALPAGIDVLFIPKLKIDENKRRIATLQTQQKQQAAAETYDRIIAALNPSQWQAAEKLLYDNQSFLIQNLGQEHKQNTIKLIAFFSEIDAGDRLTNTTPESVQNVGSSLMFYQRAEQKAKALPAGIDVLFIPRLKIEQSKRRIARLQSRQKELLAGQTYDRIIADLNPTQWQNAEKLLYDNQQFLSQYIDETRQKNTVNLITFFSEIDEGDRLTNTTPESVQKLESALMFYQRAEQKAKALPAGIDVLFIPRLKIEQSKRRIARLQSRQKELLAGQTYDRIIADLNPTQWQNAEKLLYDNQQFLSQYIDETRQKNTVDLIAFFSEIDEGDRLGKTMPESVQKLESALMFYQRAEQKAKALPADISVLFISRLKIDQSKHRIAQLQTSNKALLAAQTYDRIIADLNPTQWQNAEKMLYDNQQFLNQNLDENQKQNTAGLIAFFREIDGGDRLTNTTPPSVQNLESALMFYQRAEQKAKALPAAIDIGFIPRLKVNESQARIDQLKLKQNQLLAIETYDRITAALNPSQWQTAEQLLYDNQQTLIRNLDDARKQNVEGLVAFFREVDEGDRLTNTTPPSVQNLESALMFYQRAEKKAAALPAAIGVGFIPRLKINESHARIDQLKSKQNQLLAVETYDRIIAALNPSQWQTAEQLLYDNQQALSQNLDDARRQNAEGLVAFFREVDEGDRLTNTTPPSVQNLESALMFYQRAEKKAAALPAIMDVGFIPPLKINESHARIAKIKAEEQELAAARSPAAQSMSTQKKPALAVKKLDPKTAVKVAMKDFRTRDYDSSYNHFENVYHTQIANLKHNDKRRIKGLLSLPVKHRAEVIFLIEYEKLKRKAGNDQDLIRDGLQEVYNKIEGGEGLWSIIPESKRRKIKRHIEKY